MGTAGLIHLLWQEVLASIFHHLHPILFIDHNAKGKGHLVIEDHIVRSRELSMGHR